jgi:hypothetical protein
MSKLAQQLLDNAISLTDVYARTHEEALLDIIKSLLAAVKDELLAQPGIFPSLPALPALPSRHPDSLLPQVTAYAVPPVGEYPWVGTCTTSTTLMVEPDSLVAARVVVTIVA